MQENFLKDMFKKMSTLRLHRHCLKHFNEFRYLSTALSQESDEYTKIPQYPPILDLSHEQVAERKREAEYAAIKSLKTVEEKQIKLNMPKYYGFKCYLLQEDYIPYNNLNLTQHITRTHLIKSEKLPTFYNEFKVDELVDIVKNEIEEIVRMEINKIQLNNSLRQVRLNSVELDNLVSLTLCQQINRIILRNLSKKFGHLSNVQTDVNSRIESYWYVGGMNPPEHIKRCKRGVEWRKNEVNTPTNRLINYTGSANIALRTFKPLRPILSLSECENPSLEVPFFELDPRTVGTIANKHKHIANTPGFWPGEPNKFGLLSYHKRGHLIDRRYSDHKDDMEAVDRQGILASFSWLNAQANFLGFTTFNDVTYPLVTQTIITNGQLWSFFVYQLNTLLIHSKYVKENPQRNICWSISDLKLFEEINDGKLIGFNDEVLKNLLRFYINEPEVRLGINMTPYLSEEGQVCADYEDGSKREWLEREYKFLVANRPRCKLEPEIYAWEKIYKIDHKTKFLDKKRRPWELGRKASDRRLNDRLPLYIPRALRPHLPRSKGRYAKEYFP